MLLFNFSVKRTVRRQDFGAKFNLTYTIIALLSQTSLIVINASQKMIDLVYNHASLNFSLRSQIFKVTY